MSPESEIVGFQARPEVNILGRDGNAFAIIGACGKAAKAAGFSSDEIKSITDEMMAGDYNPLLATAMEYFDVV